MDVYGLIHQRFLLTPKGLEMAKEKMQLKVYGTCPRLLCEKQLTLPIGMSEDLQASRVKVYCPRCQEVYYPKNKSLDIDGAYFGISFPHIFLKVTLLLTRSNTLSSCPRRDRRLFSPQFTASSYSLCAGASTNSSTTGGDNL